MKTNPTSNVPIKPKPRCSNCGVEHGTLVTRSLVSAPKWALDIDLYREYPEAWGMPHKVHIRNELCKVCRAILDL